MPCGEVVSWLVCISLERVGFGQLGVPNEVKLYIWIIQQWKCLYGVSIYGQILLQGAACGDIDRVGLKLVKQYSSLRDISR